jgi:hypothetical protein
MKQPDEVLAKPKDYSEYWGAQISLVRILQRNGLRVDIKDRLPLFRLWILVSNRMTGDRAKNIFQLIQFLLNLRRNGKEPPYNGKRYK